MYNSQYYTCEQIDERLLQGYLDDYNSQTGQSLTKAQFLTKLGSIFSKEGTIDNTATQIGYYECDTAAGTAAKTITVANYALFAGGSMKVKFANKNTANNATLNINSQGAKALYYQGERASATNSWDAEEVVEIYYDGTSYYTNNVKGGSGSGVYDVSKEHPTSGPNSDGKFTLEYILNSSNVNELIPVNKRYPGMTIQFVSTSDNKYVQYRLMSDSFNTTVANWQGVDDEPTAGSDNLVKSGGVENKISQLGQESTKYPIPITESGKCIITNGTSVGAIENDANWSYSRFPVSEGDVVVVNGVGGNSRRLWAFIDSSNNIIGKCSAGTGLEGNGIWIPAPAGAVECILNTRGTQTPSYLVKKDAVPYTLSSLGGKINNRVYGDGGIAFPNFPNTMLDALNWADNTNSTCFYLPFFKGQKIKITANPNYSANYALIEYPILPTYNHQETGVGMTTMQFVNKGTTKEITAPKDCVLFIRLLGGANRTPVKVEIFGLEQTAEQVETLKPTVKELQEQVLSLSGGEKEPYGVGEYGNWASGYIFTTNGEILNSSINSHTDYIEVDGADVIELVMSVTNGGVSDAGICFYDSNKVFIPDSGVKPRVGTGPGRSYESRRLGVPDGAVYLRTSLFNEFTQYWYLKRYYSERFIEKDFFTNEVLIGSPSLHLFPAVTDTQTIINSKTAADLYAEYDAIATAHPEFLSRDADLGDVTLDGVTYAVRAYTFGYNKQTMVDHEPTNDEVISDNKWDGSLNPRKILLVSGMHGEEHTPCWGMMLAIKDIIESNDEWAQYIKSNFIFKVIPCLNPAGWSLCVRTDSQGHTLNRDEAYNDPEAIYYMDWVNANKDAFILIDCHGTQGRYAYLPVSDKMPIAPMIEKLANKLGASFFANWREFYESIVAGFGTTYSPFIVAKYSTSASWTRGHFSCRMYEDYGMQSFALETPDNLVNGYLNSNDLRNCKLTKDIFVNTLQFICGLPSLP